MVLFVAAAIAQSATIGLPAENQKINSGKEVIIQVQRAVSSRVRDAKCFQLSHRNPLY